jgi:hypothetical protein
MKAKGKLLVGVAVVHVQSLKMKMSHMILQLFVFEKYFDFL